MPKVRELEGFRFIIYPDEHMPSHIHVIKAGEEVAIELGNENEPPDLRENRGMRTSDHGPARTYGAGLGPVAVINELNSRIQPTRRLRRQKRLNSLDVTTDRLVCFLQVNGALRVQPELGTVSKKA